MFIWSESPFLIIYCIIGSQVSIIGHQSIIENNYSKNLSLIYYNQNKFLLDQSLNTELKINNLTFSNFYSDFHDGGVLSFIGNIKLFLSYIIFINDHSMMSGGALSIHNNIFHSIIENCNFLYCSSAGNYY